MNIISFKELENSVLSFGQYPLKSISVLLGSIVLIFLLGIVWAIVADIDDVVKANAMVRPADTISVIRSLYSGEMNQKEFKNNQVVNSGELLLAIDVNSKKIELKNNYELLEVLRNQQSEYMTLLETIKNNRNMAARDDPAWIRSESYMSEYERLTLEVEKMKNLLDRESMKPSTLRIEKDIIDAEMLYHQAILDFSAWRSRLHIETMDMIRTIKQTILSIEQRNAVLERDIMNATIVAPIGGRIEEIKKLNIGDTILAGEELLRIIPQDINSLKVEIYVDPVDIPLVKTGQTVNLKFPGLPPSEYGNVSTTIQLIPADISLTDSSELRFVVEAPIQKSFLKSSNGKTAILKSGIAAEARIIVDKSSALKMILREIDFLY